MHNVHTNYVSDNFTVNKSFSYGRDRASLVSGDFNGVGQFEAKF